MPHNGLRPAGLVLLVPLFVCTQCFIAPVPAGLTHPLCNPRLAPGAPGAAPRAPRPRGRGSAAIRCTLPSAATEEAGERGTEDALSAVARALVQGRKLDTKGLQAAVSEADMAAIGPTAAGWARCQRLTRIPLMETNKACVSVVLLPPGTAIAPHDRPLGEVMCIKALQGEVTARSWLLNDATSKMAGAASTQEVGFHNQEDDCVCRGGKCPRREGCKFWVELMRERLLVKQARDARETFSTVCTPQAKPSLLDSGRGRVVEYRNEGGAVGVLLECVYSGGVDGRGTKAPPTGVRWYRHGTAGKAQVMTVLPHPPSDSPGMGMWTGQDLLKGIALEGEEASPPPPEAKGESGEVGSQGGKGKTGKGGAESLEVLVEGGGGVKPGIGESQRWANFLDMITQITKEPYGELQMEPNVEQGKLRGMSYAAFTLPGERNKRQKPMQDAVTSGSALQLPGEHVHAFGVYDGHGRKGDEVSGFLKLHTLQHLAKQCPALEDPEFKEEEVRQQVVKAFEGLNDALYRTGIDCSNSGSTSCVCLVADTSQGRKLISLNVGDSRAILGRRSGDGSFTHAVPLTWDQKPGVTSERERISKVGGSVGVISAALGQIFWLDDSVEEEGCPLSEQLGVSNEYLKSTARVFIPGMPVPGLACSRSFGDESVEYLGVTAIPEIEIRDVCQEDKLLVVATDGVWEVMTNQEVMDIVTSHGEGERAGAALVERAMDLWRQRQDGSYRDDISAVIVKLHE